MAKIKYFREKMNMKSSLHISSTITVPGLKFKFQHYAIHNVLLWCYFAQCSRKKINKFIEIINPNKIGVKFRSN